MQKTERKEETAKEPQLQQVKETSVQKAEPSEPVADETFKRRIVAFTVGAVVFLCLLIVLMCYQMISIGVNSRRKADITAKIAELDARYEHGEGEIAFRRTNLYIERIARELGYHYADDAE